MKKAFIIILTSILIIAEILIISKVYITENNNEIPNNYIAIFKGESANEVHTTYLYKVKKGKKTTYKYINTTSTMNGYDNTNWTEEITKKGKFKKKSKIFEIAEKNEAYSYVKYVDDNTIYSIEQFKEIFK